MRIYTNKKEDIIQYWGNFTDIFKDIFGNIVKSAKILLMEDYGNNTVSKNDVKKVAENIEKQYNINGIFVAAVGIHESAWGTSKIARDKNNLFGYGAYDSDPYNGSYEFEEYIDGITVGEALESGTFNYDGAKKIIIDICDALEVLHTNGFVHRDIKPENIIISNNGTVKLIDFNASRINKPIASKDTTVLGTIGYAAPEQFGISQTDARADIYSLGILLNVLLTGHHPSDKIVNGLAKSIVLKCTQIDPNKRYQTVKQLRQAL